jgi:hypothetical protein
MSAHDRARRSRSIKRAATLWCGSLGERDQHMSSMQQIEALLAGLSRDELLALIEYIARRLRQREEHTHQALYDIWKGIFPEDADIDAALAKIRGR